MYSKGHNVPEESQCSLYRRGARGAIQPIQQESCWGGGRRGLVGCYSYNLCHMGSQGIFFSPCKGTILECMLEQSMYIMGLKVSEQPD